MFKLNRLAGLRGSTVAFRKAERVSLFRETESGRPSGLIVQEPGCRKTVNLPVPAFRFTGVTQTQSLLVLAGGCPDEGLSV